MKTYTKEELKNILELHQKWLDGNVSGVRADLSKTDLSWADLSRADLSWANLSKANLYGANLYGANLSWANLFGADLSWASLSKANLYGANLYGANLYGADLSKTDLSRANLFGANLSEANLYRASLSKANLYGANLWNTLGNGKEVKTLQTTRYIVTYTKDRIQIGCKNYFQSEWFNFSDEEISKMDEGALEWWNLNKGFIKMVIETNPAEGS